MKDTITKSNRLIDKNPAAITKTLYGRGIKLEINNLTNSKIKEIKEYTNY